MDREHGARIVLFPSLQVEPSKSCHDLAADGGQPQNTLYKQPMIQDAANPIPMSVSSKHSSTELTFRSTMPYAGAKNASAPFTGLLAPIVDSSGASLFPPVPQHPRAPRQLPGGRRCSEAVYQALHRAPARSGFTMALRHLDYGLF